MSDTPDQPTGGNLSPMSNLAEPFGPAGSFADSITPNLGDSSDRGNGAFFGFLVGGALGLNAANAVFSENQTSRDVILNVASVIAADLNFKAGFSQGLASSNHIISSMKNDLMVVPEALNAKIRTRFFSSVVASEKEKELACEIARKILPQSLDEPSTQETSKAVGNQDQITIVEFCLAEMKPYELRNVVGGDRALVPFSQFSMKKVAEFMVSLRPTTYREMGRQVAAIYSCMFYTQENLFQRAYKPEQLKLPKFERALVETAFKAYAGMISRRLQQEFFPEPVTAAPAAPSANRASLGKA